MNAGITQDRSVCPLCGAQNECVMTGGGDVDISLCWCSRVSIDPALLNQRLNEVGKSKDVQACICPQCARHI